MKHRAHLTQVLRVLAIFMVGAFLTQTALASEWTDRAGRKTPKPHEKKKKLVALRNNVNDACDFLAQDLLTRYYNNEIADLAVASFVFTKTQQPVRESGSIESRIAKSLEKTKRFVEVDRDTVKQIEAKLFQKNGRMFRRRDVFYYKKVGRPTGADVILLGSISSSGKYVGISASLVDVETERVLSVSKVYVPANKINITESEFPKVREERNPYLIKFFSRIKPEFSLADYYERQQLDKLKEYDSKFDVEDLKKEKFDDALVVEEAVVEGEDGEVVEYVEDEEFIEEGSGEEEYVEEEESTEEEVYYEEEEGEYTEEDEMTDEEATEETTEEPAEEEKKKEKSTRPRKVDEYQLSSEIADQNFVCQYINVGDNIEVKFNSNQDGFAFLFSIDERANVKRLYPPEQNKKYAHKIFARRDYIISDCLSRVTGCQRICLVVSDQPFALEVDRNLLRRLSCEQAEIDLPWVKGIQPGSKMTQKTFCFQQEKKLKIGEPTPTPMPVMEPAMDEDMPEEEVPGGF